MIKNQDTEAIAKTLIDTGVFIHEHGFPSDPVFIQTDPREDFQVFIAIYRNAGNDRGMKVIHE